MLIDIIELHLTLQRLLLLPLFLLLLLYLHYVLLPNKLLKLLILALACLVKLALKDHCGVESLVGRHEGRVDILVDEVVRLHLGHVGLIVQSQLNRLQLNIVEIGFHFKAKGTLSVYDKLPYRILLTLVSCGHE
jgi:hypothetical protein